MRQAWSLMVVAFFALFSQIGSMALPIFLERFELESCACAQIKTLEDGSGRFHPDEAGDPSEKERNAANLISDGGCFFLDAPSYLYERVCLSVRPPVGP